VPPPARPSFGLGARACLLLEDVAAEQVEREDLRDKPHDCALAGGGQK
jgi:hypothetical protein